MVGNLAAGDPPRSTVSCPVLVGRGREAAVLDAALRAARRTGGSAVLVLGEAGIGKSRLAREAAARARATGGTVLTGRASEQVGDLRAVREALLSAARTGIRPGRHAAAFIGVLGALVPDWSDPTPVAAIDALDVGEGVLRLLAELGTAAPALLVLEDLHWADADTLAVVDYLADNLGDVRAVLVATVRTGAGGAGEELAGRIAARRAATVLRLAPLDDADVAEMARRCLDADELPAELGEALCSRAEGMPFYLEELLASMVGSGVLRREGTGWSAQPGSALEVPSGVRDALRSRLASLAATTVEILERAAVLGRSFDSRLLADLSPGVDVAAALRDGLGAQFLDRDAGSFRFRHAITRDVLLAEMAPAARAEVARAALGAVLARAGTPAGEDAALAAELAVAGGDGATAAELLARLGESSADRGLVASAEEVLRRAATFAPPGSPLADRVDAALVRTAALAGRVDDAFALGAPLLERLGPGELAGRVRLWMGHAAVAAGRWDDAARMAGSAREVGRAGSHELVAAAAVLDAQVAMGRNDAVTAMAIASGALEEAERAGAWEAACEALEVVGRALRPTDVAAAEEAFDRAHRLAVGHGLRTHEVRALHELGTIDLFGAGRLDRLEAARSQAQAIGSLSTVAVVDVQLAALHVERFELDEAVAAAGRAAEAAERFGLGTLAMSHVLAAMAHARRPDADAMRVALEAAAAARPEDPTAKATAWGNAQAVLHLVQEDRAGAVAALDEAMACLKDLPDVPLPFVGLWALLRTLDDDGGDEARAEAAARRGTAPLTATHLRLAEAVAAGREGDRSAAESLFARADGDLAALESGEWTRSLSRRLVAEAAIADGWGEPAVWARGALVAFEQRGHRALAAACRRLLAAAGEPVPRRGRGDASVPPELAALGLTSREVDVLVLVAGGLGNAEVARRLHLSPRTVEKHVERVLAKTGRRRSDLADLAAALRT